ncbi:acyl-CoA N-acyltransferase [Apiospora arundinis]
MAPAQLTLEIWGVLLSSRETLKTLCKVSKGIAQVAQSVLFRWYNMTMFNGGKRHLLFLRSILDSPRLAASVREVEIEDNIEVLDEEERTRIYGRIADRLGFDTNTFPLATQQEEADEREVSQTTPAIILLLLPLLPNLTYLTITGRHEDRSYDVLSRLHQVGHIKPLASVTQLGLHYNDTEMGFDLYLDSPILALTPNATTLNLSMCCGVGVDGEFIDGNNDDEDEEGAALLACCPRLERFSYYSGGAVVSEANEEVDGHQVVAALAASARATLKMVALDFQYSMHEYDDEDEKEEIAQDSFAGFTVLEKAIVDERIIVSKGMEKRTDTKEPTKAAMVTKMMNDSGI